MMRKLVILLVITTCTACAGSSPDRQAVREATAPDGERIAYEVHGAGDTALVFIHGWMCNRNHWRHQLEAFQDKYTVAALDLAGHGQSSRSRKNWTLASLAKDVVTVVNALEVRRIVLIGHSMGGPVAVMAADELPGRVAGIIAVDAMKRPGAVRSPAARAQMMQSFTQDFAAFTARFVRAHYFHPASDPALAEEVAKEMAAGDQAIALALVTALEELDAVKILKMADGVPLGFINSDAPGTDKAEIMRLRPTARIVEMPNVRHFPMLEDPNAFNQVLQTFLADWRLMP